MTESLKSLQSLQKILAEQLAISSLVRAAVEDANEAFLVTTSDIDIPKIVYVNKSFEKMTGYTSKEVVGKTPKILQGPKTNRSTLDRLKKTLKDGKPFFGRAINYRKDGSEYILEWHISPVFDEDNHDVTQYVSIQRRLDDLPLITQQDLDILLKNETNGL